MIKLFLKNHKHKILYGLLSLFILAILFPSQCYRFKSKKDITNEHKSLLESLGEEALISEDVPVSAILIYKDSIIGTGYNTVKKNHNLSGHAEINAMNMAYDNYGEDFFQLDREELILYSTFEPCAMCKGALIEFKINQIYFERPKPFKTQLKNSWLSYWFEIDKRRFEAEGLQESLFEKHPDYNSHNE